MKTIGIAVTTRNSATRLDLCLMHYKHFLPSNYICKFVVVDDCSDKEINDKNFETWKKYDLDGVFITNSIRQGIAKSKNECLRQLKDCDYIFLSDDDAWSKAFGWADLFIESAKKNSISHLMYLRELQGLQKIAERNGIETYDNCGGVMLYLNKKCLEKVGGYRKEFGHYSFEHADYSQRCNRAGLCGDFGPFISPVNAKDFIYSIDFDLVHHNEQPPLANIEPGTVDSSLDKEKIQSYINENLQFYNTGSIYEALI